MAKARIVEHVVRTKDGRTIRIPSLNRGLAIKLMCGECLGWDTSPEDCTDGNCPLYPFRGRTLRANRAEPKKRIDIKRVMSDEQKAKMMAGRRRVHGAA